MKIIGLTGGTGSGKSVVSEYLKKRNGFIIDCDKIAHEIIEVDMPAYFELIQYFGEYIIDKNKNIDRKKLGEKAFSDKEKLAFLNECTHKYISNQIFENIGYAKNSESIYKFIVIDAPLLIEGGLVNICDSIWVVFADEKVRIERIMKRDNITYEQAQIRISVQKKWYELKKYADVIIDNSDEIDNVESQLDEKLQLYII